MGDPLAGIFTAVEPGTGHVLAMSVNRRFGCDGRPDCESVNLNVMAERRAPGPRTRCSPRPRALAAGFDVRLHADAPHPYISHVYKKNGGTRGAPYTSATTTPGTTRRRYDMTRRWSPRRTPTSSASRTPSAASRAR